MTDLARAGTLPPPARLAWTVWSLGAALYLYGFFQRVAPGVMGKELSLEFDLGAAALGNLSAFYFYSYVAMQIPTGLLADGWGPRRLLTAGAVVAAIGSLIFAMAPNAWVAGAGRLLVGGSVAVAFVGMLKLASHWLPPSRYALASGLALFAGICGAVTAGVPLQLAVAEFGWRSVMGAGGGLILLIGVAIWLIVRDDPEDAGYQSHAPRHDPTDAGAGVLQGLQRVLAYRNTWLAALVPASLVGSLLTFSGLWGVPFLTSHYGMSATEAAAMTTVLLVAWAVGGPIYGAFSDRIRRRKLPYVVGVWVCLLGWITIVFVPDLPTSALMLLLAVIGFFSGSMIISFVFGKESVPPRYAGTVSGVVNMGVMTGPMVLQPAVGWMLDHYWQGELLAGVRVYDLQAYQAGFSLMLGWLGLAAIMILFTHETHCRQLQPRMSPA